MRNKENLPNVDQPSVAFPMGRIRNDDGSGNGTPVVEQLYGDIVETVTSFMEEAKIVPNGLPDSAENGYQIAEAFKEVAGKFNQLCVLNVENGILVTDIRLDNIKIGSVLSCSMSRSGASGSDFKKIKSSLSPSITYDVEGIFEAIPNYLDYVLMIKVSDTLFRLKLMYDADRIISRFKNVPNVIDHGKVPYNTNEGSGIFTIEHRLIGSDAFINSNLFISISRKNATFSPNMTQASYYVLDRHEGGFRVIFSNININSELDPNSRVVLDWQIVTYAN